MFPLDLPPSSADVVKEFADDASWVVQEKVGVQDWKGCVLMRTAVVKWDGIQDVRFYAWGLIGVW